MKRWPLVASFILFIALCASAAYWAMQLFKPPLRAVAAPPPSAQPAPKLDAAAGLFGGRTNVAVASNYQLKGVVVSGNAVDSVAILATDGKPAQSVRINAEVVPGVTIKEVHRRYVLLSENGVAKRVELPEDAKGQSRVDLSTSTPVPTQAVPAASPPIPPPTLPPPTVVVSPAPQQQSAAPGMGMPSVPANPANSPNVAPSASPAQPQQR